MVRAPLCAFGKDRRIYSSEFRVLWKRGRVVGGAPSLLIKRENVMRLSRGGSSSRFCLLLLFLQNMAPPSDWDVLGFFLFD